jgi:hypothetical protein
VTTEPATNYTLAEAPNPPATLPAGSDVLLRFVPASDFPPADMWVTLDRWQGGGHFSGNVLDTPPPGRGLPSAGDRGTVSFELRHIWETRRRHEQ